LTKKAKGNTVNLVFRTEQDLAVLELLKNAASEDERDLAPFIMRYLRFSILREKEKSPAQLVAEASIDTAMERTVRKQQFKEAADALAKTMEEEDDIQHGTVANEESSQG
jgi:hypothetical protein